MDLRNIDANSAYAQALSRSVQEAGTAVAGQPGAGGGFAALVENLAGQVEQATSQAEAMSAKAVAGQAGLVDVVTAVNNAEMVLDTVTTVRDRVVRAYEEIMRMPI